MKKLSATLILAFAVASCSPLVRSAQYADLRPTPDRQDVQLFEASWPQCGYDEVGTISVRKRFAAVAASEVKMALQDQAREMGGDGVIALCNDHETRNQNGDRLAINDQEQEVAGTVIKFHDRSCMY